MSKDEDCGQRHCECSTGDVGSIIYESLALLDGGDGNFFSETQRCGVQYERIPNADDDKTNCSDNDILDNYDIQLRPCVVADGIVIPLSALDLVYLLDEEANDGLIPNSPSPNVEFNIREYEIFSQNGVWSRNTHNNMDEILASVNSCINIDDVYSLCMIPCLITSGGKLPLSTTDLLQMVGDNLDASGNTDIVDTDSLPTYTTLTVSNGKTDSLKNIHLQENVLTSNCHETNIECAADSMRNVDQVDGIDEPISKTCLSYSKIIREKLPKNYTEHRSINVNLSKTPVQDKPGTGLVRSTQSLQADQNNKKATTTVTDSCKYLGRNGLYYLYGDTPHDVIDRIYTLSNMKGYGEVNSVITRKRKQLNRKNLYPYSTKLLRICTEAANLDERWHPCKNK
ncbi:hypothetical protein SNE40_018434 [Patella caerulea]|uniref:Uncharacterized protein n=1 Tax=Patella caerulea TaxID=87958 RepID=A0AAN8PL77_PATCE